MAVDGTRDYYDELETVPPEQRENSQNENLQQAVRHAYTNAPTARKLLDESGINPDSIKTAADLEKLPVTRKNDLIQMQKDNPPFGGFSAVPPEQVERIFITPGPIFEHQDSHTGWFSRSFWAAGFRRGDIVINTFTYHLSPAGMLFHEALRDCGATVVVAGTGNTDLQLEILQTLKVTGFVGTPSYLMTLIKKAEEQGKQFTHDFYVKKAWFTGEMLAASVRKTLENEYAINTSQAYAVTEPGGCIAYECPEKNGLHFMDDYIIEIIDPATGKQLPPGETGEIVVTPLHNREWGLLRFGTGDLSAYITEPCPCGRTNYRLTGISGRVGDAIKVRGMFVVGKQAEQVLCSFNQVNRYRITVTRPEQRDEMTLLLELKPEFQEEDKTALAEEIAVRFQSICRVKPDTIEFTEPGILPKNGQSIVDERKWK